MQHRTTAHHRPVRRANREDLDMAFDAGQLTYQNQLLQEQVEQARRKLAPPPRGKRIMNWFWTVLVFGGSLFFFFWLGQLRATAPLGTNAPLPTAVIVPTRPPYQAPAASGGTVPDEPPTDAPQADTSAVDAQIATYNAAQHATATALQAAPEAAVDTAPAPTALPEPGTPDFGASFQEATCPPAGAFYTPLRGSPCYGRAGQAPLPQSGDAFADSFH